MPSPVGHALAGIAVGWIIEGRPAGLDRAAVLAAATYAFVAAAPDLDLLLPTHRGPSHGIGAAAAAGALTLAITRRLRSAIAIALAYGSHIVLDWLGTDTTPPIGLMALWPFSRDYYESPYHVFMAVSRRYWLPEFWTYNFRVLMRELLVLAPLVFIAGLVRGPRRRVLIALVSTVMAGGTISTLYAQDTVYADAVATYRGGDHEAALRALGSVGIRTLERERKALERAPFGSLRADDVPAAIMLHTEWHFESAAAKLAHLPSPHLEHARRLARRCLELLDAPSKPDEELDREQTLRARSALAAINAREFVQQWYLLVIAHFQGMRQPSRSAHYLQEARFLFPGDEHVLLASGSHHEMLLFTGSDRVPVYDDKGNRIADERVEASVERTEAARYFRAALGVDPALEEAQLRLGRMLYLSGDLAEAARELEALLGRVKHPSLEYLSAIFLALVEEDRNRRQRAAELYLQAMKAVPEAQAAFVGVSELLYVDAQPEPAAEMMKRLLERPAPRDPWWSYIMGEWWHFDARLRLLRAEARK